MSARSQPVKLQKLSKAGGSSNGGVAPLNGNYSTSEVLPAKMVDGEIPQVTGINSYKIDRSSTARDLIQSERQ